MVPTTPPFNDYVIWGLAGHHVLALSAPGGKLFMLGFMPVVPMVIGSALCVIIFSLLTPPPSEATIRKYFEPGSDDAASGFTMTAVRPTIAA